MTKEWIDVFSNLFSGFAGVVIGCYIAYYTSSKLESNRQKEKQKLLYSVLNDILKQIKIILVGSFGIGKAVSPYGYIKNAHEETNAILPLFDNIIAEVSILPPSLNKTYTIELYSELKGFLSCNEKYKIKLEKLKQFRKEMVPDKFVKLNCKNYMDYFDIDPYLFNEESNPNSVIDKDFFKAQKTLIDDLVEVSNITWNMYLNLVQKIDKIINNSWEAKK